MTNFIKAIEGIIESKIPSRNLIIAKVISPPPDLKLEYSGVVIETEQIYCSNYLLPNYKRKYKLEGIIDEMKQTVSTFELSNTTTTAGAGEGPHVHSVTTLKGSGDIKSTGNYKDHGDVWFTDTLEVGCEVLVGVVGVVYVVMDRIVKMPSKAIEGGA